MAGILIVEDDTTINEMVARNLKMVGHKCTQVYDGKEGLEMIENGDFDLVLLDVMLPGMSGVQDPQHRQLHLLHHQQHHPQHRHHHRSSLITCSQ